EHELSECAMQVRNLRAHHDEPRAGHANGGLEIQSAQTLAELDVVARLEGKRARLSPAPYFDVRALVLAVRHGVMQQVGNAELPLLQFGLYRDQLLFRDCEVEGELLALCNQRGDIATFGLRHADSLGIRIALRAQPIGLDL